MTVLGLSTIVPQSASAEDKSLIKNAKTGFCIDGYAFGKEIKAAYCRNHYDAQRWTYLPKSREIKHTKTNLCLNISVSSRQNGAKIDLWKCNGGKNQQWYFDRSGAIRSVLSNKCIDISRIFSGEKSANVTMWDCNKKSNQKWQVIDAKAG